MDCVCIDQSNITERAQQVKIMHLIYKHAKAVLIWLGCESHDSALAFDYMSKLDATTCVQQQETWYHSLQQMDLGQKSYLINRVQKPKEPDGRGKTLPWKVLKDSPWSPHLVQSVVAIFCRP
jgi:hypothetical protein